MRNLGPCKQLEHALQCAKEAFDVPWWLGFGGLWAIVKNNGIIPDGDLDFCTLYKDANWRKIKRGFESAGYQMSKALLNDIDKSKILYMGFNRRGFPHICVSFWYPYKDLLFYCHDQRFEVSGEAVPSSGYFFKGVPASTIEHLRYVDWPGIPGRTKVQVPRFPGAMLDALYPDWAYRKQKTEIRDYTPVPDREYSYHSGGAISKWSVHVQSIGDLNHNIDTKLAESNRAYEIRLKRTRKK